MEVIARRSFSSASFSSAWFNVFDEVLVNFDQNANHKGMEKMNKLHFSPPTPQNATWLPISVES